MPSDSLRACPILRHCFCARSFSHDAPARFACHPLTVVWGWVGGRISIPGAPAITREGEPRNTVLLKSCRICLRPLAPPPERVVNRIAFARSDEAVRGRSRSPPTPPAVHTAERVRQQIEAGRTRRARRTNQELDGAFQAHADEVGGDRRIPRARLQAALREFHAGASEAEVDHFLLMRGGPADGSVDLEDFREAARTAWAVETWAQSLTGGEIRDIVEGVRRALQALLMEHVTSLRRSFRAMDNQAAGVPGTLPEGPGGPGHWLWRHLAPGPAAGPGP
jgi:hypothetical protein